MYTTISTPKQKIDRSAIARKAHEIARVCDDGCYYKARLAYGFVKAWKLFWKKAIDSVTPKVLAKGNNVKLDYRKYSYNYELTDFTKDQFNELIKQFINRDNDCLGDKPKAFYFEVKADEFKVYVYKRYFSIKYVDLNHYDSQRYAFIVRGNDYSDITKNDIENMFATHINNMSYTLDDLEILRGGYASYYNIDNSFKDVIGDISNRIREIKIDRLFAA